MSSKNRIQVAGTSSLARELVIMCPLWPLYARIRDGFQGGV